MLVSKTKQGDWFSLGISHDQEQLKKLRRKEVFFCPECGEQVILKVGTKRISHFAHQKGVACAESYERESEYHLKGKILLYKWLESQGLSPVLEPYNKEIAQRPDIGLIYGGKTFAIEYQCSIIPEELFIKRTENYLKAGITPIWIMAAKNIKRKGNNRATLSGFDYLFLSKRYSQKWTIPAFCPVTNTLITMDYIIPVTVKNVITHFFIKDLKTAAFSDLLGPPSNQSVLVKDWQYEIRKGKMISPLYGTPQNKFLQELYAKSFIPSLLPPEIGLPVSHAPYIETPAIQWQSFLFIDVLNQRNSFTLEQVYSSFKSRVWKNDIKVRRLPLHPDGSALTAVKQYVRLLVEVNVLETADYKSFWKKKPIKIAENQMQQEKVEKEFYRKYAKIIINSLDEEE